jgi:hypothetical protein
MEEGLSERFHDLLDGTYDCVDRLVLNAYFPLGHSPGGFRTWWRQWHDGSDAQLDNAHLIRMAGRFARRVRAWSEATGIPVIHCTRDQRKHEIAEQYLATHPVENGIFLVLVARAQTRVWQVDRARTGYIRDLSRKKAYVSHYSFHLIDPEWGHVTIKMAGHPPFDAQIILNGHEYVAGQARQRGIDFLKEGNCFTKIANLADLATAADTLSGRRTIGRLTRVCERWIYSACLCFGLELDEQRRSGFHYEYSVYQGEYSRNLLFRVGGQMEQVFERMVDRTRAAFDVPRLRTLFGAKQRPRRTRRARHRVEVVVERPQYPLTLFKLHFGNLTLKAYTKGERVLRFEAIAHNTRELRCGRRLDRFPDIIVRLKGMLSRFLAMLNCVDVAFIADQTLEDLPRPSEVGRSRVGGIDLNKPRLRTAVAAAVALAPPPHGFTVGQFLDKVHHLMPQDKAEYSPRQAAYDLKKLRGKQLITKLPSSRRYQVVPDGLRTMAGLLLLRDHVIKPLLPGINVRPRPGRPKKLNAVDADYERLRWDMHTLFQDLGLAA